MQHFDIAVRRSIILRPLKLSEVGDYCFYKCHRLNSEKIVEKIEYLRKKIADKNCWTLALQDTDVFGILEVEEVSKGKAKISIEIPNEMKVYKYGFESVDQFIKLCEERHYFKEIELETQSENRIMKNYIKTRRLDSNLVTIVA